jgi:hypothetical protein
MHPGSRFRSDRGTARARLTEVEVSKIAYNSIPDPAQARGEFHRIIARDGVTGATLQNGPRHTERAAGADNSKAPQEEVISCLQSYGLGLPGSKGVQVF